MEKQQIFKTLGQYKKVLEDKGYQVIYIGLYGSQNYNLDDELSDIDCKAIIMPSLHDIIFRNKTSTTVECENGNIDVKDLITFYEVIRKGNFSYIESIDTEYSIGDKYIKELFKQIRPNLKSFLGAMHEKRKALTHEYPSKHEEFEKWGFDPKQLHHILRLRHLLEAHAKYGYTKSFIDYKNTYPFSKYGLEKIMIKVKRNTLKNPMTKEGAIKNADGMIDYCKQLIPEDYKYEPIDLSNEVSAYLEKHLKTDLLKDSDCLSAREYRTFDSGIPKKDLEKFPILEQYKGQDISYIVYESIEIL